jgi:hypothetical protein
MFKAFTRFLAGCWKGVLTVVGVIGTIVFINSFYSSLATSADLQKAVQAVEQKSSAQVLLLEKKTEAQIQQFQKSMELDRDLNRLNNVNDNLMRTKQQLRVRPKDKDLQEDYEALKEEKIKLQQKIEKR